MPETLDLYNNARQRVCQITRGAPIPTGLNKLSVHVWFINSANQFLLQQRVGTAKKFPNMWGQTGGGAISGETSWDTCVRESTEELGLTPTLEQSVWVGTFKRPMDFVDVWLVHSDAPISDLRLQPQEVQSAMWASMDDIAQLRQRGVFIPSILPGLNMVNEYLKMQRAFNKKSAR